MALMSETHTPSVDQLPAGIRGTAHSISGPTLKEKMENISHGAEKQMILDALNKTNQNRTRAAKLLNISRRTLQNKIKEYGL
jgi:transcriptional regulator with PAS, ATPase and Fis domain